GWSEGGSVVSMDPSYSFTVTGPRTLMAGFDRDTYQITVSSTDGGSASGGGVFEFGESVTVVAQPDTGRDFIAWSEEGVDVSTSATYTFTAERSRSLVARFIGTQHTVTVSAGEGGAVSGGGEFDFGTNVTVVATPQEGFSFERWTESGGALDAGRQYSFLLDRDRHLTAHFSFNDYTVTGVAGEGGVLTPETQVVDHGERAELAITPEDGYDLKSISGCDGARNGNTYITSPVTGSCTVTATFGMAPPEFQPAEPERLEIDATGLFTPLPEDVAPKAVDWEGKELEVTLVEEKEMFRPGAHTLTWQTVDARGVEATVEQTLYVWPIVSVGRDVTLGFQEGSTSALRILLNGPSPEYPFEVAYHVGGTARIGQDHDLDSGTVTFNSGEQQQEVRFSVLRTPSAGVVEHDILIELDDEVNRGSRRLMSVRLLPTNLAPTVVLRSEQDGENRSMVVRRGGEIRVRAGITDPNPHDTHTVEWHIPTGTLLRHDEGGVAAVLSAAAFTPGVHEIRVVVTDSGSPPLSTEASLLLSVREDMPELPEGAGSIDESGLPDHPAYKPVERNVLPERGGELEQYLMEADSGLQLRLGAYAALTGRFQAQLDDEVLRMLPPDSVTNVGGIFDFEVRDIPAVGESVNVVIPQPVPVPQHAVYRKYDPQAGEWRSFVEDLNNVVASAPGKEGYCPPPGSSDYRPGLAEGDWCVQLTIQDGGPNDADGRANGVVVDPGGVGTLNVAEASGRSGGGGAFGPWMLVALLLLLLMRFSAARRVVLVAMVLMLPAHVSADSPWYLGGSVAHVVGDRNAADVSQRLQDQGHDVDVTVRNRSRTGWRVFAGYSVRSFLDLELGYVDLGEVRTRYDGVIADPDDFLDAATRVQPAGGHGVDLTMIGHLRVDDGISFFARGGLLRWSNTYRVRADGESVRRRVTGIDPVIGLGTELRPWSEASHPVMQRLSTRLEGIRYRVDGQNLYSAMLSLSFRLP
ncbi:MAG: hypothetical protein JJT90_19050, partial [Ectothiorhodospiraceae bacterium]|nr:hypothetical protein [Ectothiorhodospiraceae bacterium]